MFFDTILTKSASLSKLWRLGHNQETGISNEKPLCSVCDRLDGWISNDNVDPRGRMSLRSAAVLVAGSARLCLQELDALVEDVTKLGKKMAICRKRLSDIMEVSKCQNSSKRSRSSVRQRSSRETRSRDTVPDSPPSPSELQDHGSCSQEISLSSRKQKMNRKNSSPRHSKLTKDQAIQTMESSQTASEPSRTRDSFQQDLPFCIVHIYDNPQTRIPSKMILSTINPDILN